MSNHTFLKTFSLYALLKLCNCNTALQSKGVCPNLQCDPCPYGYEVDFNSCYTCKCVNPCKYFRCQFGEYCVSEQVYCNDGSPCGGKPKCVKRCPFFFCGQTCIYGFEKDCNNCPICRCAFPCTGVVCPMDHFCSVEVNDRTTGVYIVTCMSLCKNTTMLLEDGKAVRCFTTNPEEKLCPEDYECRFGPYVCCKI